jgi:hypothetical protein
VDKLDGEHTMQTVSERQNVNIFDASDRFYMCRKKLEDFGQYLESITEKDHPGMVDLLAQYSVLRTISNRASAKFEKVEGRGDALLKSRELQLILSLEILIHEFETVLIDAQEELSVAS